MKPNKNQRVRAWAIPETHVFWGGADGETIVADAPLTSPASDTWLFGPTEPLYEAWYISQLDEVWVYDLKNLHFMYRNRASTLYSRGEPATKALIEVAGEPAVRWPCPETPEELRTLCRMFYELHGGSND